MKYSSEFAASFRERGATGRCGHATGQVVDLDDSMALRAAKISADNKLPMANSIILATARQFSAIVWTQDADFVGFDDVEYFEKQTK